MGIQLKILILLLLASPVHAELRVQLPTATERRVADVASWTSVVTLISLDAKSSWDCIDRLRCFELQGLRTGVVYGSAFAVKFLVHRARPCAPVDCGSDNPHSSFFSAHTAIAFSTLGGPRLSISLPLASATGVLRVAAGKHWMTDVIAGAAVGSLVSRIR